MGIVVGGTVLQALLSLAFLAAGGSNLAGARAQVKEFERRSLKRISTQRLYHPRKRDPKTYPNLQPILTRPIDWALIRNQYD